MLSDTTRTSS